jgi:hypothetical protein
VIYVYWGRPSHTGRLRAFDLFSAVVTSPRRCCGGAVCLIVFSIHYPYHILAIYCKRFDCKRFDFLLLTV